MRRPWLAVGGAALVVFVTVTCTMGSSLGVAWLGSWGMRRSNDLASEMVVRLRTSGMSDAEYAELLDNFTKTLEAALRRDRRPRD
ncbi:MAG: hypothetical protein JW990_16770 [Thermoleophilia bacterium]|nr:hypothetical protein [Thermoleophilia bacterium]